MKVSSLYKDAVLYGLYEASKGFSLFENPPLYTAAVVNLYWCYKLPSFEAGDNPFRVMFDHQKILDKEKYCTVAFCIWSVVTDNCDMNVSN